MNARAKTRQREGTEGERIRRMFYWLVRIFFRLSDQGRGRVQCICANNKKDWRRILAMAEAAGGAGTCITNEAIDRTSRRLMIPSEIDGRHALDLSRDWFGSWEIGLAASCWHARASHGHCWWSSLPHSCSSTLSQGGGGDWLGIVGPCHRQLRDKRVGNFRCGRKLKIFPPS